MIDPETVQTTPIFVDKMNTGNERMLLTLMGNLPGIAYRCRYDRDWTMEFISEGCIGLTGYPSSHLVQNHKLSYNDLIVPEDKEEVWEAIGAAIAAKRHFVLTYRIVTADRKIKWVWEKGCGVYDLKGNILALEGFITDLTERKVLEEALAIEKEQLSVTLNSIGDAVITTSVDGKITYLNPVAEHLTGWKSNEAIGQALDSVFCIQKDLTETSGKKQGDIIPDKTGFAGFSESTVLLSRNETRYPITISAAPIRNDRENIFGTVIVFHDLTREYAAKRIIDENEERYRTIIDNSMEGIILQEASGRIVTWNKAAERIFGIQQKEATANTFTTHDWKTIREDGSPFPADAHPSMRTLSTGMPCKDVVMGVRTQTDDIYWINVNTNPLFREKEINPYAVVITFSDITGLKQAESLALRVAAEWQTTFDATNDAIWILDHNHRIVRSNKTAERFFGLSTDFVIGKPCWEIVHGIHFPIHECPMVKAKSSLHRETTELNIGSQWLLVTADPILNSDGQFSGAVHIVSNISDRKQFEKEKENLQEQLIQAQKMEAIGRLAGGVAHDFNNLVSIILGYGELVLDGLGGGNTHREPLEEIHRAALRARDLTRQLLAFSRKQVLEMKIVDVNSVVTDFQKMLHRMIGEDIRLHLLLAPEPLYVEADVAQLEQVLMNLSVNARDAMPDGGILRIETAIKATDNSYLDDRTGGDSGRFALIRISDTGCGMDQDTMRKIFDPFFTTKEKDKGTGLGLATSYGIIQQHGGKIEVQSELGRGTIFQLFFPLTEKNPRKENTASSDAPLGPSSATIIVIEDDPSVRKLACLILKGQGYQVIESNGGLNAVRLASDYSGSIDLVLTDVIMPEMKGPEVFNKIKLIHPKALVLYMSGYTDSEITRQGVLVKGVHFIEKPFSVQALTAKVKLVLATDVSEISG